MDRFDFLLMRFFWGLASFWGDLGDFSVICLEEFTFFGDFM